MDTDESPVGENVRRWTDAASSGSPSPDSDPRSFISFKPKEHALSSSVVVVGRAMLTDDRLVPTTRKDGVRRAGPRQYYHHDIPKLLFLKVSRMELLHFQVEDSQNYDK